MSDSDEFGDAVLELLRKVASEPPPPQLPVPEAPEVAGRWAAERAQQALWWALRTVTEADNVAAQRLWSQRQDQLRDWMIDVGVAVPPDLRAVQWNSGKSAEVLATQLHGIGYVVFSELEDFCRQAGRQAREREQRAMVLAQCSQQAGVIVGRLRRRLQPLAVVDPQDHDIPSDAAPESISALSAIAARHLDANLRRILDLDDETAGLSIVQWYERCGIDYRPDQPTET